jgi:hypothetical protein
MKSRSLIAMVVAGFAALLLVLTACGSSGGGGGGTVDQSQLEKKLNADPEVGGQLTALPSGSRTKFIDCVAGVAIKDANHDDLNSYIAGKKSLDNVRGQSGKTDSGVQTDATNCAKQLGLPTG